MSLFEAITKEEFESSGVEDLNARLITYADEDATPETSPCTFCGHCETPDACAWSRECPKCHAPAGIITIHSMCKTPTGGIVGLHAERWL